MQNKKRNSPNYEQEKESRKNKAKSGMRDGLMGTYTYTYTYACLPHTSRIRLYRTTSCHVHSRYRYRQATRKKTSGTRDLSPTRASACVYRPIISSFIHARIISECTVPVLVLYQTKTTPGPAHTDLLFFTFPFAFLVLSLVYLVEYYVGYAII